MAQTTNAVSWIDIAQLLGIVVGFGFTIRELRIASRLRKFDVFWKIGESHREVWRALLENASLHRVLEEHVDLGNEPVTIQEQVFLNSVILHIENVFQASESGYYSY